MFTILPKFVFKIGNVVLQLRQFQCIPKQLEVMTDGQQRPLHYRYKIVPKDSVNAYKPKELEQNLDRLNLRPAQFGAVFHQKYSQMPTCEWCKVIWEVGFF